MEIRFSQQEIKTISTYFNKVDCDETRKQLHGSHQEFPEWNIVFLLLRKLLAYGIHYNVPADPEISYENLQKKSQKPDAMLATVHAHLGQFQNLLAIYTAHHVA